MKFVVDANVLFALANPASVANSLVKRYKLKLIAPDFALVELYKYKEELSSKSNAGSFSSIIASLKQLVVFVDRDVYVSYLPKSSKIISDEKDVVYLALALSLFIPIWTNDSHFKEQSLVSVFTTKELVESMSSLY